MTEKVSPLLLIISVILSFFIIFAERFFPFALFSTSSPPPFLRFIEKYIPPMMISLLTIYSLRDIQIVSFPYGLPTFLSILAVVLLHLKFKNSMLSIFLGTALYMILSHFF